MQDTVDRLYFIPHTHWEGAVFQTRDAYLDMGLPNITRALALLRKYPDYRFVLDQACYVKPYLERYPHEADYFRQCVDEGRLAIVGGTDVMLDVNMPGGESFVRQVLYAKRYFREALGVDVTTSWQLDTFGHHAQMPQLLKLAGFESFWFFRGVPNWETPGEFLWEGIDGSRIPAFWLPHGYAVTYGSPASLPEFAAFMKQRYDELGRYTPDAVRVGPAGADVVEPEEHVPALTAELNAMPEAPVRVVIAVPADYEKVAAGRGDRPVLRCELNPVFQGIYSSRIELKQRTRELEGLLTSAEKLGVMLRCAGNTTNDAPLWEAWEPMLFNQAHDIMSGVLTDRVYWDTIAGYEHSRRVASAEVADRFRAYAGLVDTEGAGIPVVVANMLGWARTDVAVAKVGLSGPSIRSVGVVDQAGRSIPSQLLSAARHTDGSLVEVEIAFIAHDVPALGHAVYRLVTSETPDAAQEPAATSAPLGAIENEHYRVTVDASGAITSLVTKCDGREVLRAPGNVVARQEDRGDFWEPYKPLDGGSRIAMTDRHPAPRPGEADFSTDEAGETVAVVSGPVMSQVTASHGFGKGTFSTTIRLYAGLRRIDVHTSILNNDEAVRYRVLFPTSIKGGVNMHEIPFGAIERPEGIEFPAQSWFDTSDGERGLAILNRGLPGANTADGTMMVSLFRSTCIVAYGFGGGYGPGMSSDTGFALGKELSFDYSLVPHSGAWCEAGLTHHGQELNVPLLAAPAASHVGTLGAAWGLVTINRPNVVVSAMRTSEDGSTVLRIYEAVGEDAPDTHLEFGTGVVWAEEVGLMEDPGEVLPVSGNTVRVHLTAFEIKTLRLALA